MYEYRILITGSRDWPDPSIIHTAVKDTINKVTEALGFLEVPLQITIVHGNAFGTDLQAEKAARELKALGFPVEIEKHPITSADWNKHGKRAGYLRNQGMVNAGAEVCLAFIHNNSAGASMCANLAEKAGIPVFYFRLDTTAQEGVESSSTEQITA